MEPIGQSKTAAYYAQHANEYFEQTSSLNPTTVYEPFEHRLKPGSRILDLGSGSGRDARYFAARGHSVVALDPCRELLALAEKHTPEDLRHRIAYVAGQAPILEFEDNSFDAVWACASLLHILRPDLPAALDECHRVLRQHGLLFVGLKQGDGESDEDGRLSVFWQTVELRRYVTASGFVVLSASEQKSLDCRDLTWINLIAKAK